MSLWGLVKRSLGFYWRTNLGVLLAVAAGTAVLTGALAVGDSMRHSLLMMVAARLGDTQLALVPQNRFFRDELADELSAEMDTIVAPVLNLRGTITTSDGTKRANRVEVLGVDERFFQVGGGANPFGSDGSEAIVVNRGLAAELGVEPDDEVVLRIVKPGLLPRDAPLSLDTDLSAAFRLRVKVVAGRAEFGRLDLQANHVAPLNVFVPIRWLQEKLGRVGQANMILVAASRRGEITVDRANEAVSRCWQLADAALELRELEKQDVFEIRSKRIFIEDSLAQAAMDAADGSIGVLTYFVNEFRLGERTTPYSVVCAMDRSADVNGLIPIDMRADEILTNEWLAEDLEASVGDVIELSYFVIGPMRKLQEAKSSFRVRGILPMEGTAVDPELMPDYPGLAEVRNCRDWEPGIPIDLSKIRKRDEDYWDKYRGTPKAFVTLEAGQMLWGNRYGNLTAVRYPRGRSGESVAESILSKVDPASVGLFFQSVRARGIRAGNKATDFGQLFLGFNMFIILAAVVLMALVFVFGVESRSGQVGMLLAVGFTPRQVWRLLFVEGGILAVLGAVGGTVLGLLYTKAMIYGLVTLWRAATSNAEIHFSVKPSTLAIGAAGGVVISLIAIWLTLRKQVSRPARELLAGNLRWQFVVSKSVSKGKIGLLVTIVSAVGAVVLLVAVGAGDSSTAPMAFFSAGALLLVAGLGLGHGLLRMVRGGWTRPMVSLAGLGLRNATRRTGRSLAVIGLLASGIFLVVAVGANRHDPLAGAQRRDSGTGGFALLGESSVGILHDLNSASGRAKVGLDEDSLEGVEIVQLRVREGDEASCLNLNRAQTPRLLGVEVGQLEARGAFRFVDTIEEFKRENAWDLLNLDLGEDIVPAIGDYATIVWSLGRSVGDELEYLDEKGRRFRLRLVAMLGNSILQGSLLIAEDEFVRLFPSEEGYRMFLIDAAADKTDEVAEGLSSRLRDYGFTAAATTQRLAVFNAVENTYLSIFQLLGGLGVILGSVGLGLVVLRNMLDRRGELAMLRAVGFDKTALNRMVFYEHCGLMFFGLVCGVVAALVAAGPALRSPGGEVPYLSLVLTIAVIAVSGLIWIRLATTLALGGEMLEALRNE